MYRNVANKAQKAAQKWWQRLQRNQRLVAPAALVIGFVLDNLTLNRIDQVFDQTILIVHLLIVATTIALLYRWYRRGQEGLSARWANRLYTLMAFSMGGIYSGLVIFYGRSGSVINSWPLLLVLVLFLFGSEFGKRYFKVLSMQLVAFLVALYLHMVILIPILADDLGSKWFIVASLVWLILSAGYLFVLAKFGGGGFRRLLRNKGWIILAVLVVVSGSYVAKVMPPVPLSLKFDAAYYSVIRSGNNYQAQYQPNSSWRFWDKRSNDLVHTAGQPIYVFTSVFAPNNFTTQIYHEWQYQQDGRWITTDRIPMTITGGGDNGYRGYSYKRNLAADSWRVRTTTANRRVIGVTKVRLHNDGIPEKITEEL